MKKIFASLLILFIVEGASQAHPSFAQEFVKTPPQKNLEKFEKRYQKTCPEERKQTKKCKILERKILKIKKQILRKKEPSPSEKNLSVEVLKEQVLKLTNQERGKIGLAPLKHNALLEKAAQKHTDDMQQRDYMAHESPEGVVALDRIKAEGYLEPFFTCTCNNASYFIGENLAKGQLTPEEVVKGWMASEGHRKNILNPEFMELGVGMTFSSASTLWTQNFGAIKFE